MLDETPTLIIWGSGIPENHLNIIRSLDPQLVVPDVSSSGTRDFWDFLELNCTGSGRTYAIICPSASVRLPEPKVIERIKNRDLGLLFFNSPVRFTMSPKEELLSSTEIEQARAKLLHMNAFLSATGHKDNVADNLALSVLLFGMYLNLDTLTLSRKTGLSLDPASEQSPGPELPIYWMGQMSDLRLQGMGFWSERINDLPENWITAPE